VKDFSAFPARLLRCDPIQGLLPPEFCAKLGLRVSETLRVFPSTPADWALQWVWNQPEVSLALSGMTTMQQVEENVASASRSGPGTLAPDELALIDQVTDAYRELCPIPCTDCRYCQPCPNGVAISRIFALYNDAAMFSAVDRSRMVYEQWMREEERADCCLQCGECESACPQGIQIIEWLKKADGLLASSQRS
jgi:predicted aldo/keto reductase-like oxidoreductase